jgi:hypothetical protein
MTFVVSVVPLMTTTEDETKWLPFTVRRKPAFTSANVIVVAESDPITGAGLALPHRGFSALQPGKNGRTSRSALSCRKETPIRFISHRTPGSPWNLGVCDVQYEPIPGDAATGGRGLYEVNQHDPVTIFSACALLTICALVAAHIPARRAASIDPMQALRTE